MARLAVARRPRCSRTSIRWPPPGLVAAAGDPPPAEVLDAYVTSTHTLVDLLGFLTSDEWIMLGESPLGHVSVSAVVRHALGTPGSTNATSRSG